MKAYSLSTPEGDSLLDYEDEDALMESLCVGLGTMRGVAVWQLVMSDHDAGMQHLRTQYGVTLTVHNDEDEGE